MHKAAPPVTLGKADMSKGTEGGLTPRLSKHHSVLESNCFMSHLYAPPDLQISHSDVWGPYSREALGEHLDYCYSLEEN